jgi:protein SCO1
MKNVTTYQAFLVFILLISCHTKKLPIIGESEVVKKIVDGNEVEETIYPVIPDFSFLNQNGDTVTGKSFDGKIYVADFFFTTCPTICPVMKKNMLKVYAVYKDNPGLVILSHTIDPEHDSVSVLKQYAKDIGVTGTMWQFVTGDRAKIYDIGERHYFVTARQDTKEAGGYMHSGRFVLVDKNKHIRGMYDGTTDNGTQQLIDDIEVLLKE